jgi:predicted metal-binding membrane protein
LGAGILVLAGVYQFTPLKYHCLDKCRSPLSFIMGHWTGKSERTQALRLGLHHGIFCIGCCWSLMLLMFAVGSGSIGWMLILGALMAVEKNVSWGRRLSRPLGVLLLGWGVAIAAGARFLAL